MLSERLIKIIDAETPQTTRFKVMENITGIAANSWKSVWHQRQRPTAEMIESVAKNWPNYAYWLATGDTEPEFGHIAPQNVESEWPIENAPPQKWTTAERLLKQQLLKGVPSNQSERNDLNEQVRNQVFELRSKLMLPGTYMCFERIRRALQSDLKDDLFLLEFDEEMRNIRMKRYEETLSINKAIYKERENMSATLNLEDGIQSAKSLFTNILNKLKFPQN